MTEIQGKSILVRVSARFELAIRVRVIGSQPYLTPRPFQADPNVSTACSFCNFITLFDLPQNTNNKTVTQKQMKVARKPKKKP